MSDAPPEGPAGKDPFVIVPTLDGYLALEGRVAQLEAAAPAIGSPDAEPSDLAARLDRHRLELDELKRRYNALVQFLDEQTTTAAPTPGGFL